MTSKYSIRPVTPEEIQALFWDERKKDFIFPSQEDMQRYIEKSESKKLMENPGSSILGRETSFQKV